MARSDKHELDFLNAVLEHADILLIVLDREGRICRFNKASEKLTGYNSDDILGKYPWETFLLVDDADRVREQILNAISENPVSLAGHFTYYVQDKNGERYLVDWSKTALTDRNGVMEHLICVGYDISEQKRIEDNLRIKESAIESSINAIAMSDLEGKLFYVNPAFVAMWRLPSADTAIGRSALEFWDKPEDAQTVIEALQVEGYWQGELRAQRHDGIFADLQLSANMVRDCMGNPLSMMASFIDISDRKRIEQELIRYQNNLKELVLQRTKELEVSLAEKEVLLMEVHHRVKNNLAMVSSFIRLQMSKTDNQDAVNALSACDTKIRTLALTYKKIYHSVNLSSIDMQDLLSELFDVASTTSELQTITCEIKANNIQLTMDVAIPCALIVNELITNAFKYAFVDNKYGKISINLQEAGPGKLRLEFSDNGGGLPDDLNINNTDTLGLQLVNIFAQQLHGTVSIDNSSGTKFIIEFPAVVQPQE
jgi:PAS domain S-box-containing protein